MDKNNHTGNQEGSEEGNLALLPKLPTGLLHDSGEARDIFLKYGMPHKRSPCAEGWKYTPLNDLANRRLRLPTTADSSGAATMDKRLPYFAGASTLLFIDGFLQNGAGKNGGGKNGGEQQNSLPKGSLTPYRELSPVDKSQPMAALNLASRCESWRLVLSGEQPLVHIISLSSSESESESASSSASSSSSMRLLQTRLRIEVAAGSKAIIFQSSLQGATNCCVNDFLTIEVGDNASLEHMLLHSGAANSFSFTRGVVNLGSSSHYSHISSLRSRGLTRHGISVSLSGTGSSCTLHGGYRPEGSGHIDNSTEIIHAQPGCISDALYKGAISDSGSGVFHGKIYVAPDAQSTKGYQMSRALLLSDRARAYHKPELEIYADDVKCSHGATVGSLDEEQMFYLRSRGLDTSTCEQLLLEAFLCEALTCEREDCATALRNHMLA